MFYIYTLTDPITNQLFYIGKGSNYRCNQHLLPSKWKNPGKTCNPFLYSKIKTLFESGTPPLVSVIKFFHSEQDAYDCESKMILEQRTFNDGGPLLNISTSSGGSKKGGIKPWTEERRKKHRDIFKLKRKFDPSYQDLYDLYIVQNLKRTDISNMFNVSTSLIKNRLASLGIKKEKQLESLNKQRKITLSCPSCDTLFDVTPSRGLRARYCSQECSQNGRKNGLDKTK